MNISYDDSGGDDVYWNQSKSGVGLAMTARRMLSAGEDRDASA